MPNTLSTWRARRTKSRGLQGLQLEVRAQRAQRILVFNIWSPPGVQCLSPPFAEVRLIWPGPGSVAKPAKLFIFCSIIFIIDFDCGIPRQVWRPRRRRQWWRWRRGGGGARARWGGRRRETSWTWWTSFASLLCPHQKDLDLSQTIPVTKELVWQSDWHFYFWSQLLNNLLSQGLQQPKCDKKHRGGFKCPFPCNRTSSFLQMWLPWGFHHCTVSTSDSYLRHSFCSQSQDTPTFSVYHNTSRQIHPAKIQFLEWFTFVPPIPVLLPA